MQIQAITVTLLCIQEIWSLISGIKINFPDGRFVLPDKGWDSYLNMGNNNFLLNPTFKIIFPSSTK
jgi:hypothetical protein